MASASDHESSPWKFPSIKTTVTTSPKEGGPVYYGVYFYPFTKPGDDPVFAVIGGQEVIIARPNDQTGIETIRAFRDDGFAGEGYCAAAWTRNKRTGAPLLAVGGAGSVVKILDVLSGECVQTLTGHGEELMDIIASPVDQNIIVSTGADTTIRFWSLDPAHKKQPCSIILAGEGHRETVLNIAFHHTGRYLLSGGMDHSVNLWAIPENAGEAAGTDRPLRIMYPHFSTSVIHSNYVDVVAFHGDYILSKSAYENKIVLWAIQNFNSKLPPPPADKVPTTHEYRAVRSAFGGTFERILQFKVDDAIPFFMRPGLFAQPGYHPILAMGNSVGKIFLWDLYMIEMYGRGAGLGGELQPENTRDSGSPAATPASGTTSAPISVGKAPNIKRDDISELFGVVKPHHTLDIKQSKTTIRHIAFSLDGKYMVVVGENSTIIICKRW